MSDEGEEPPPRLKRSKRPVLFSSDSSSDSDDSGPAVSTRRKALRVVSDESSESSGSSVCEAGRRRRALPALPDSDGSAWDSDRSDEHTITASFDKAPHSTGFASDSSEGNSDKCSICLMRFTNQPVGTPQSCEHIFCLDCITEWSKNVNTCPVDRSTFEAIVVRARAGGRVLRSQPVQPVQNSSDSLDMFIVDNDIACQVCGGAQDENTLLLCDRCDAGYHMGCLSPPLARVPRGDWFCPPCAARRPSLTITVEAASELGLTISRAPRRRRATAAAPARRARRAPRTRRRTRDRKSERRRARTAARRAQVRVRVRAALAAQGAPAPRPGPEPAHRSLAVPRLALFDSPDFDYFSGDERPDAGPGPAAASALAAPSAARAAHRQARRKLAAAPAPDLLAGILAEQTRLHARRSIVSVAADGAVSIELIARKDPRSQPERARRRPASRGERASAPWGGGYRYPAEAPAPRAAPLASADDGRRPGGAAPAAATDGGRRDPDEGAPAAFDERRPHRHEDERPPEERRRAPPPAAASAERADDKYDPTEPTRDDDSGDDEARAAPAPPERPPPAPSDDDSDGDCPNFSIYSAASVHIARDPGARAAPPPAPRPPSGLEDLVQEDGAEPPPPRRPPDYKERLSRRCPITADARDPIKIRLNAPSLIRRKVALSDDDEDADAAAAASPEAPAADGDLPAEPPTDAAPDERPPPDEEVRPGSPPEEDDASRPRDLSPGGRSADDRPRSERSDEGGPEGDARESESGGTPSLPADSGDEEERARLAAALHRMTESISDTEDERGYTPCLDERHPPHLDTELISDAELSGGRPPSPPPARRRRRASAAARSYRRRRASAARSSEERARRKDKRKDLERYDVRTLVSERRRRPKDAFGRDVSPRAEPEARPASPRRSPPRPSPRRSLSPARAERSPRREPSPPPRRRRRRRSASRARKRRRDPSGSPKPKPKKKKRARSSSRAARRRSPKRKRARRRSAASPRPPSPRTPPPAAPPAPPPPPERRRKRRDRSKHRRARDAAAPSKEVFTSGDNILVSVSFKEAEGGARRARRRPRRAGAPSPSAAPRPVAIIDLERSPFRELTPPHQAVIVLSDDERPPPEPAAPEPAPAPAPAAPPAPPAPAAGPNTPPEPPDSPDAYDPYEPTRSASASPAPPAPAPKEITLEAAQKTNMSADEVLDRRPLSPAEKVLALLQSTRDEAPEPPPAAPPEARAPSPPRAPPKLFLAKPSPIKSDPIKPMQFRPAAARAPRPPAGGDSPYSPGSSDFGDLFEPPAPPRDPFDALADKPPRKRAAKQPKHRKKGKTQVEVKLDDASLKIMDELPSSAVEMQLKTKFLKKLNRQERVVEEVKLVLKPHYNKKHVSKDEYKHILRRAVPKICHNKSGEINPTKIQALVEAYVKKFRKKRKLGLA